MTKEEMATKQHFHAYFLSRLRSYACLYNYDTVTVIKGISVLNSYVLEVWPKTDMLAQ